MMTESDMVDAHDLPPYLHAPSEDPEAAVVAAPNGGTLAEMERRYILQVLGETGGVISAAASRLGIPRTTLNGMMRKLEISRKDF
jgi:DNA-binding NtrC family response regulator